jgi:endonuclease/exonuclease/phosphatase family metal-dependent hydrolase
MKIATLNTWATFGPHEKRWNCFLNQLTHACPQLLFLQEATDAQLLERIKASTPLQHAIHVPKTGLAILSISPFLSNQSSTYAVASKFESYARGFIAVTLAIGKHVIAAANTHLSWRAEDAETRAHQVTELLEAVERDKVPALLAGDFNDTSESVCIGRVLEKRYRDLYRMIHPSTPGITWDNHNPFIQGHSSKFPDRRIDFLFADQRITKQWRLTSCDLAFNQLDQSGIYPSDHYGVIAELEE